MRRRTFGTLLSGTAAVWPLGIRAQQRVKPVIGYMSSRSPGESATVVVAFHKGLAEQGFVEGQNLDVVWRWAEGQYDRLPAFAAEFVQMRVNLIYASGGPPSALAAKAATTSIPIVFSAASDPVGLGLAAHLNRPGKNVTGMSTLTTPLAAKGVELLKELLPNASTLAYLINPSNPSNAEELAGAHAAAKALGVEFRVLKASSENELDATFAGMADSRPNGLVVSGEPFFDSQRARILALAARHRMPAIYAWRENVVAGGLMSYGTSITDMYRQSAVYAGRILKGEKPAELPIMQPTKFELLINLTTAKTLGLAVPRTILARADEVIE
jgi:putative ABC transport system substrate-binding protein